MFKGTKATSLDLLRAVYMNAELPLSVRMRAAGMAIPYEYPKLSVVASVNDPDGFAERLERAIQRSGIGLMIEHAPAAKAYTGANLDSRPYARDRAERSKALTTHREEFHCPTDATAGVFRLCEQNATV